MSRLPACRRATRHRAQRGPGLPQQAQDADVISQPSGGGPPTLCLRLSTAYSRNVALDPGCAQGVRSFFFPQRHRLLPEGLLGQGLLLRLGANVIIHLDDRHYWRRDWRHPGFARDDRPCRPRPEALLLSRAGLLLLARPPRLRHGRRHRDCRGLLAWSAGAPGPGLVWGQCEAAAVAGSSLSATPELPA
jgi:hypothetical protein